MKQNINVLILPSLVFMALVVTLAGCSEYKSPSIATLYQDNQAGRDVKNEKYEDALAKYYSLLSEDVARESTHSNIGVLLNMVKKPEEGLKSLQHALKLAEAHNNPEMIFKVHYNLGVYYGALKKIPEALEHYQSALDIIPDSHEIKTNIELLLQQQKQDQKQQGGEGESKKNEQPKDEQSKDEQPKDQQSENEKNKPGDQKKSSSPKYQPRPFKGDQLSEGDVKKILGELKNQEQKIRAHFDKKEKKGKTKNNEKDW